MAEDYHTYLERVYPGSSWSIDPISGGYINKTIRVTKVSGSDADVDSLILKHAKGSFGEEGRKRVFSLKRQDIERTILQLWEPSKPLHGTLNEYQWRLPKCLRQDTGVEKILGLTQADDEASVLLIEDLGPILDIYTCLETWAATPYTSELVSQVTAIGKALGASLAKLHSSQTVNTLRNAPSIFETLSQSLTNELVWKVMIDPLPRYLQHLADAEELCRRVTSDIKTPASTISKVLCHGDFHNGNVMLPSTLPQGGVADVIAPIVVDWEFAHLLGRGVNGDAAEFTAGIHCHLIKARGDNTALAELLRALLTGFCSGYRETAGLEYGGNRNGNGNGSDREDVNLELLRSAFLFHGTEMISCAYEYEKESTTFEEVFKVGVWYLRTAGRDGEEFKEMMELKRLEMEEDEGIVTSLFVRV